jgi:hypothetical protein
MRNRARPFLRDVVVNGGVTVHEEWDYDNLNGGTYGHAVTLTVPEEIYFNVMQSQSDVPRQLAEDLNKLNHTPNEYISAVFIEMEPVETDRWREESGVYRPRAVPASVSPGALQRIWGPKHVRVFLSHKASVKKESSQLKEALERCGLAAFVAHEDIEPTEEWRHEIERALFSMDALVAYLRRTITTVSGPTKRSVSPLVAGYRLSLFGSDLIPMALWGKRKASAAALGRIRPQWQLRSLNCSTSA